MDRRRKNNPAAKYAEGAIFERHLRAISKIEYAIKHGGHYRSVQSHYRHRERDADGRYLSEEPDEQMF